MSSSDDDELLFMPTFGKAEHLCNIPEISELFSHGHTISKNPLKLKWLPGNWNNNPSLKVVISVPKHKFKKASDRNRIKRLLREGYRLNKLILIDRLNNRKCYLGIVYTGNELPEYKDLEAILIDLFYRLIDDYEKNTD